jgi:hypothetical protein
LLVEIILRTGLSDPSQEEPYKRDDLFGEGSLIRGMTFLVRGAS